MRLINCKELRLEELIEPPGTHPFAILFHTWDAEEVTYQQFADTAARRFKRGWAKIQRACATARECGCDYLWDDTCCIDKQDNAELTESIYSMFQWYSDATVCLAFIADFDATAGDMESLRRARWFSRGWTLQELIAPSTVYFYDREWRLFGTRSSLYQELSSITGISTDILSPPDGAALRDLLDDILIARRMAWAARRHTTKKEDIAYCPLGIFGVNMPMLYGEVFAWTANDRTQDPSKNVSPNKIYRGILASSPAEFAGSANIEPNNDSKFNPDYFMSNKGLRIQTVLHATDTDEVVMPLNCHLTQNPSSQLGLILKHQGASVYVRSWLRVLGQVRNVGAPTSTGHNIFVAKRAKASITRTLGAAHRNAFHFRFDFSPQNTIRLVETAPAELWDAQNRLIITSGSRQFTAFHRFAVSGAAPGQFVIACGMSMNQGGEGGNAKANPWRVCVGGETGELFGAAAGRNFQAVADIGRARGFVTEKKKDLKAMAPNSTTWKVRFAVANVSCAVQTVRGEQGIVVAARVTRNTPMGLHM
ncbi:Uu.00g115230.m01.CDS01 [Anthostomella pinea]|uniref:Uu.00g115230.m01.CDS01 n=1 Tax=Anthostomella pinea TaxID=933095 RepID=A0AAI8VFS3_9PEZI|nr:Uu.00g115230.m01.CDS01 [Anthostomella pinea]